MKASISTARLVLARGETLNLDGAEGARIINHRGSVWITQNGDLRDIVLGDGESFELDRPTPAIVQAFECSSVTVAAPTVRPRPHGRADWLRRLRAATRRFVSRPAWA
jgi:hypothetical protein